MLQRIHGYRQALTPQRLRQLWYIPSLAAAMGFMLARTLIMARFLSVDEFAVFSRGILVSGSFGMLGCLGLQSILQRDWPMMLVRGQEYRGLVLAAQSNLVAMGCAVICLVLAAAGASIAGLAPPVLFVGILHGFSQQFFIISTVESRSRGRTLDFARQNLMRAVIVAALSIAVAVVTGSALAVLGIEAAIVVGLSLGFFQKSARHVVLGQIAIYRLAVNRFHKIKWKPAAAMMAISIVGFMQFNADRWFASSRLDHAGFANYSFACIILVLGQSLQALINASLYPFIARYMVRRGQVAAFKVCCVMSVVILVAAAAGAVPLGYISNYVIHTWYPRYDDALDLVPVLLAVAALRLSDFWSSFLAIAHHENLLLALNLAAMGAAVLAFALIYWSRGSSAVTMEDAATLAVLLCASAYAAVGLAAWYVGSKSC
jgi:O-antigen/teichoic acid export membrane protein